MDPSEDGELARRSGRARGVDAGGRGVGQFLSCRAPEGKRRYARHVETVFRACNLTICVKLCAHRRELRGVEAERARGVAGTRREGEGEAATVSGSLEGSLT